MNSILIHRVTKLATAVVVAALWIAPFAKANPIQVAYSPVLTQTSSDGDSQILAWATASIGTYNSGALPGSPLPGAPLPAIGTLTFKVSQGVASGHGLNWDFGPNVFSKTIDLTGFTGYIELSWGGSALPVGNGTADYLYYVNGVGSWTFYDTHSGATGDGSAALANGGLSGVRVYGNFRVPEGGLTVAFVGLGLLGLFGLRRRLNRS